MLQRIITGIFLILLVIAAIFYLPFAAFIAAVSIILSLAAWEMSGFFWPDRVLQRFFFTVGILLLFIFGQMFAVLPILISGGIWWLFVPYILTRYAKHQKTDFSKFPLASLTGFFTFVPFAASLVTLNFDFGSRYLLFLLFLVWSADIGAYFAGKFFGKNLLAKNISPKKTREGLYGGLILALLVAIVVGFILHLKMFAWLIWMFFTVVIVLWSVLGDLFESMLKRMAGVKDSGNILPGHGGIYDRIDSLTAAAPIFAIGMLLLKL